MTKESDEHDVRIRDLEKFRAADNQRLISAEKICSLLIKLLILSYVAMASLVWEKVSMFLNAP